MDDWTRLKSDGPLILIRLRLMPDFGLSEILSRMDDAREANCLPSANIRDGSDDAGRGIGGGEVGLGRSS